MAVIFKVKFLAVKCKYVLIMSNHCFSDSAKGSAHYPFAPGKMTEFFFNLKIHKILKKLKH